ncbi:S8 family serine peptidase [Burkholderia cenocepacia]|nr:MULTISPECIES: S8 family serine peptidase [Burkholderia cepacia complex]ACA93607.1 peptidase S8 and S53 subtilisin kexin sedolisin [Burkholderia orbicola MC0-3]MBJ9672456.1 S8 family serine peptidase [Burkholderia cenocepacia]MBJ9732954.1 S8 family serine peptidase [Burkholderia cenocepacia]MBR8311540.1 S8 family serine peptidase [Burkholderia cenocepacia]MCA7968239.1 S8 family serine peptidase [Burkholderia cenocepacia]
MQTTPWAIDGTGAPNRYAKAGRANALANRGFRRFVCAALVGSAMLAGCNGDSDSVNSNSANQPSLVQYQWHLQNTGQSAFAKAAGTPGFDLDVASLFAQGETGTGVRVLVLDDGLDIHHPDLKDRIDSSMLYNFEANANSGDPTPLNNDAHGTTIGGIIGATGIGVRGVAPRVTLGGARYLCKACDTTKNKLDAFGAASFSANADIINASFGIDSTTRVEQFNPDDSTNQNVLAARLLEKGRQGKGVVLVKAAGNDYIGIEGSTEGQCTAGVSCGNANYDPQNTMPQTIVVAAVNALGKKSSYSSASSAVLVSGFGGEWGNQRAADWNGVFDPGPAILTTDLAGCGRGDVRAGNADAPLPSNLDGYNPFDDPGSSVARSLNPSCNYTAKMNGTSAATPTVAGVVALMLHANPNLTWRDVRAILMKTARRIDSTRQASVMPLPDGESYTPEPTWTQNHAGFWFDNWYGFGLVDAAAAVSMARNYTTYLTGPMKSVKEVAMGNGCGGKDFGACGDSIPVGVANGYPISIQISDDLATIEAVQLTVHLGQARMSNMAIELISPSKTRSVLLNAYSGLYNTPDDVFYLTLASNAFNGESAKGTWTLKLIDVGQSDPPTKLEPVKFKLATLNVMGH